MAIKTPEWTVTVRYAKGQPQVVTGVRNTTAAGAERLVRLNCADAGRKIVTVESAKTGLKFSGQA